MVFADFAEPLHRLELEQRVFQRVWSRSETTQVGTGQKSPSALQPRGETLEEVEKLSRPTYSAGA
jgi:hypothetical protein